MRGGLWNVYCLNKVLFPPLWKTKVQVVYKRERPGSTCFNVKINTKYLGNKM